MFNFLIYRHVDAPVSCIFDHFHHFALCLNVIQNFVVNFSCFSLTIYKCGIHSNFLISKPINLIFYIKGRKKIDIS